MFGGRTTFGDATTEEMTGGRSTTVTDVGQFELLPDASVAVRVTDVVPNPNVEPEEGRQLAVTDGQWSSANRFIMQGEIPEESDDNFVPRSSRS